jgi:hypothetical protein
VHLALVTSVTRLNTTCNPLKPDIVKTWLRAA